MKPLQVHLMLHKLHNWTVRDMTDAAGNKCLHICIPMEENAINLVHKKSEVYADAGDITAIGWNFMAIPSFRADTKEMYGLVPSMSKANWEYANTHGLVDPERKNFHQICGSISPWPYSSKSYKSKKELKEGSK